MREYRIDHRDPSMGYPWRRGITGPDNWRTMTLPERIRARVHIDENGCWIWQGAGTHGVYGLIHNKPGRRPRSVGVHRVMYEEAHGPIPEGVLVAHVCGVKLCCNPDHLELLSRSDSNRRTRLARSAPKRAGPPRGAGA
jgi:hypothetical protein